MELSETCLTDLDLKKGPFKGYLYSAGVPQNSYVGGLTSRPSESTSFRCGLYRSSQVKISLRSQGRMCLYKWKLRQTAQKTVMERRRQRPG